jgi:hypothetical protein
MEHRARTLWRALSLAQSGPARVVVSRTELVPELMIGHISFPGAAVL